MDANPKIRWARTLEVSGWMSVGAVLAFGALGIIGQIHFSKDAPAWVQAIGSVGAILVAIAVAVWQKKHDQAEARRADVLKARSLGAALVRDIKWFRANLRQARQAVLIARPDEPMRVDPHVIPTPLWNQIVRLHEMGEPGNELLKAIELHHRSRDIASKKTLLPSERSSYLRVIEQALEHCEKCINGVQNRS